MNKSCLLIERNIYALFSATVHPDQVKDVRLPQNLQRAMAAEAEATREARAKVIVCNLFSVTKSRGKIQVCPHIRAFVENCLDNARIFSTASGAL